MTKQQNQTMPYKILIIFASALLLGLFLVGIIQTFFHKSLLAKNKHLENQNESVQTEIDRRQQDQDFINDPDGSEIVEH